MNLKYFLLLLSFSSLSAMGQGIITPPKNITQKTNPTTNESKGKRNSGTTPKPKKHVVKGQRSYDVDFSCNVLFAVMHIDGEPFGSANRTRNLTVGMHKIDLSADGYEDLTEYIDVAESRRSFHFDLVRMSPKALYDKALQHYNKKEYGQAKTYFSMAANDGHTQAQAFLGYCYAEGLGTKQSDADAVKWYRKAADNGNVTGQYNMGVVHHKAMHGLPQDNVEALRWFKMAAAQGHSDSEFFLGKFYQYGYAVSQNYAEAVKWYQKSVDQGNCYSMVSLGYCYDTGTGVTKDNRKAYELYKKAADKGHPNGYFYLGLCYLNGSGISANRNEAIRLFRIGASKGDQSSKNQLKKMGVSE